MNSKIEQAIVRLQKNVKKNKSQELICFEENTIRINKNESEFWGTFFYTIFLIIIPFLLLIYKAIFEPDKISIGILILLILTFLYELNKIIVGGTIVKINLEEEYLTIENKHILFKKIYKSSRINFHEINKSELIEKSIQNKYTSSSWLRLSIKNTKEKKYILTDFKNHYPNDTIAKDVKNLIDSIIKSNTGYANKNEV